MVQATEKLDKPPLKHHSYLDFLYCSIVSSYTPIAEPFQSFISLYYSIFYAGFYVQSRNEASGINSKANRARNNNSNPTIWRNMQF
jgi:hypothetical protein